MIRYLAMQIRILFIMGSLLLIVGVSLASPDQLKLLDKEKFPDEKEVVYPLVKTTKALGLFSTKKPFRAREFFSVSVPNSIGAVDTDKNITFISLKSKDLVFDDKKKDILLDFEGEDILFVPSFSPDIVGYAQTRIFTMLDLKTNKSKRYNIWQGTDNVISKVDVLDPNNNIFAFDIDSSVDSEVVEGHKTLLLSQIGKGGSQHLIASRHIEPDVKWVVQNSKLVLLNTKRIMFLDKKLAPSELKLTKALNRKKPKLTTVDDFVVHPSLPFAVIVDVKEKADKSGRQYKAWLAIWHQKEPIFIRTYMGSEIAELEFSPDGKWMIFVHEQKNINQYYAARINKQPPYIGSIRLLGSAEYTEATTWIANPTSFVVAENDKLRVWDLDKISIK